MIHQLNDWLKDGLRYTALDVERNKLEKELASIREQVGGLQRQVRMKQIGLTSVKGEQETAQQAIYDAKTGLHLLRNEEFYQKVQSYAYVDSSRTLTELKQACKALEREREGLMKERSQLEMEQSNRWSGGEKWSKNMTLFLGLLNYVAERRQYIKANRKLHRAVILDNPFGKASSEHVLSPVFFIAEQLGFQIIALTAHAEGKFLQDYFPIVYSCRLRSTSDASKQIIEPSKRVQHASFRDHAPETLERIDARVDQMELF